MAKRVTNVKDLRAKPSKKRTAAKKRKAASVGLNSAASAKVLTKLTEQGKAK